VYREFTLSLPRRLRSVSLADPAGPLTADSTVVVSPAEWQARHEADRQRLLREDQQAIQRVLASVNQAVQHLHVRQQQLLGEMQKATVELALSVASWLVHKQVEAGEFPVEKMVQEALQRLGPQRPVTVFLHPADLALLESRSTGPLVPQAGEVNLAADRGLTRGGCHARAGDIEVLSKIEEHLAVFRRTLLRELEHAEPAAGAVAGDRQHG